MARLPPDLSHIKGWKRSLPALVFVFPCEAVCSSKVIHKTSHSVQRLQSLSLVRQTQCFGLATEPDIFTTQKGLKILVSSATQSTSPRSQLHQDSLCLRADLSLSLWNSTRRETSTKTMHSFGRPGLHLTGRIKQMSTWQKTRTLAPSWPWARILLLLLLPFTRGR